MLIRSGIWRRQPTERLGIKWGHPLTEGLVEFGYSLASEFAHSAVQFTGGPGPFKTGTITGTITRHGHALTASGTGNYINLNRNISASTQVATGWVRTRINSLTGGVIPLTTAQASGANYAGHWLQIGSAGGLSGFWGNNAGSASTNYRQAAAADGTIVAGEDISVAFVCRAATDWSIYKDGVNLGAPTYAGTASAYAAGTASGTINYRAGGTDIYGDQSVSAWAYWSRALTDAELWEFEKAPFQILMPYTRRVWVSASVGAYTLTAATGSFTLTGQAATLKAARLLTAAAGSFSLSGQAATFTKGYGLTAGAGTFALSGQSAALTAARKIAAGVGAFTLGGQAATLTRNVPLTAAAGGFTLSGQAATLLKGSSLSAGVGAFTLTGQSATLTKSGDIVLTADVGGFTLSGQAATLTKSGETPQTSGGTYYLPADPPKKKKKQQQKEKPAKSLVSALDQPDADADSIAARLGQSLIDIESEIAALMHVEMANEDDEDAALLLLMAA